MKKARFSTTLTLMFLLLNMDPPFRAQGQADEYTRQLNLAQESAASDAGPLLPNGNFKTYDSRTYSISYPENWETSPIGDWGITIEPQGPAKNKIASVSIQNLHPDSEDVLPGLLTLLSRSIPKFKLTGKPEEAEITVNGVTGKSVMLKGKSRKDELWFRWVLLKQEDGTFLWVQFTAAKELETFRPTFDRMLNSLRLRSKVSLRPEEGPGIAASTGGSSASLEPTIEQHNLELQEGQTPQEVEKVLGKPNDTMTVKGSLIYIYPTVKVIFENGKLVDVQYQQK